MWPGYFRLVVEKLLRPCIIALESVLHDKNHNFIGERLDMTAPRLTLPADWMVANIITGLFPVKPSARGSSSHVPAYCHCH